MPASAPTVDDLIERTARRAGFALLDVGLFLDGPSGTTGAIRDGLYLGCLDVGAIPLDWNAIDDDDVKGLGGAAVLRITAVAELHCLRLVLGRWHLAVQTQGVEAIAKSEDTRGGWLWEEKQALMRRVADLEQQLARPYADPLADTVAVFNRPPSDPCGCPGDCR